MSSAWRAGALAVTAATLLPLLRVGAWWIRVLDFPRAQVGAIGVLLLLSRPPKATARRGDTLLAAALALCVGYQLHRIRPYTPFHRKEAGSARWRTPDLSLIAANVLMSNRQASKLLESIRRHAPDLVLISEADAWWEHALRALENDYPYTVKQPQENTYGMLLYSRLELIDPRVEFLVQPDVPSIHCRVTLPGGEVCALHCVHPHPPSPLGRDTTNDRDAELLIVGERVRRAGLPAIVAGDLNDVAWSHTTTLFQRVSRLLDPRKGRGMYNTFHAHIPLLRFPLDHVFYSDHFGLIELVRLPAFGSDHFPIYVSLALAGDEAGNQEAPALDREDAERARSKIAAARSQS